VKKEMTWKEVECYRCGKNTTVPTWFDHRAECNECIQACQEKEYDDYFDVVTWGMSESDYFRCRYKNKYPGEEIEGIWEATGDPRYFLMYKVNGVGLIVIRPSHKDSFKKYKCINYFKKSEDEIGLDKSLECIKNGVFNPEELEIKS